jgi:hypothetical protein
MASAQQRRPAADPVTCTFPVSWPVAATVTVTVEPHGRNVHLTYVVPGRAPKVSSMPLGPITYGIVTTVVAAIARVQAGSAHARPAAP